MSTELLDFENMSFDDLDRLEEDAPVLMGSRTAGVPYANRRAANIKPLITLATIYSDELGRSFAIRPLKPVHREGFMSQLKKSEKVIIKDANPDNLVVRVGSKDWLVVDEDLHLLADPGVNIKKLKFRFEKTHLPLPETKPVI